MSGEIKLDSPDYKHLAVLKYVGEIRFGPEYYSLKIDKIQFKNRIFGDYCRWSEDSRYFAIQEWLTTDYEKGPITRLILVDVRELKECLVSSAVKGFLSPIEFEGDKLKYTKLFGAQGITQEFEQELSQLQNWKDLI